MCVARTRTTTITTPQPPKIGGDEINNNQKSEAVRLFLCVARRQVRSIVDLCEELDDRSKVQKESTGMIFLKSMDIKEIIRRLDTLGRCL